MTLSSLTVGNADDFDLDHGTLLVAGGSLLVVTNADTDIVSGT